MLSHFRGRVSFSTRLDSLDYAIDMGDSLGCEEMVQVLAILGQIVRKDVCYVLAY